MSLVTPTPKSKTPNSKTPNSKSKPKLLKATPDHSTENSATPVSIKPSLTHDNIKKLVLQSIPSKYINHITVPSKITSTTDQGILAYHGETDVEHITVEYGNFKDTTVILPALVNIRDNNKLKQISVML
jgi:hypothetical protein